MKYNLKDTMRWFDFKNSVTGKSNNFSCCENKPELARTRRSILNSFDMAKYRYGKSSDIMRHTKTY